MRIKEQKKWQEIFEQDHDNQRRINSSDCNAWRGRVVYRCPCRIVSQTTRAERTRYRSWQCFGRNNMEIRDGLSRKNNDVLVIQALKKQGLTIKVIAELMGRTPTEVTAMSDPEWSAK